MPNRPTVLIIDDDRSMRLTLSMIVQEEGYSVLTAASGEEGLAVAERAPVDVALIDMKMPGISGDEVCLALKRIRPAAEVILVTAHVAAEAAERAMAAGADSIVYKPLDLDALLGRISALTSHLARRDGEPRLAALSCGGGCRT